MVETFTIDINSVMDGSANLVMMWGNHMVMIPIKVDVQEKAMSNIKEALASAEEDRMWAVKPQCGNLLQPKRHRPKTSFNVYQNIFRVKAR